jgi:hypothetical protein
VVVTLTVGAAMALPVPAVASTTKRSPIALVLVLPRRTVASGGEIHATVIVKNSSNHRVSMNAACPGQEIEVGLSNKHMRYTGFNGAVACFNVFSFRPGSTVVHVVIHAEYEVCGAGSVPCGTKGARGLPLGTYTTTAILTGFPTGTKPPQAQSVVVTG